MAALGARESPNGAATSTDAQSPLDSTNFVWTNRTRPSAQALSDHGLDVFWYDMPPTQTDINMLCARLWHLFQLPECGPHSVAWAVRTGNLPRMLGPMFGWVRVPRAVGNRVVPIGLVKSHTF